MACDVGGKAASRRRCRIGEAGSGGTASRPRVIMMDWSVSSRATIRRFFRAGFTAADIAEYLISYDANQPAGEVHRRMVDHDFDVVGLRDDGFVVGYVCREDLAEGVCSDHLRYFGSNQVVAEETALRETVIRLGEQPFVFVTSLGAVGGIVTRGDLQKPAVRMWLFGLITLVEHAFGVMIRVRYPDGSWHKHLSEARLRRAERFQAERRRRNESLNLVDCLALSDKGQVLFKDAAIRQQLGMESKSAAREALRNVEKLRNSLSHAHDIVTASWQTIVNLSVGVDNVLGLYESSAWKGGAASSE
jgi:hypothetical protein